jgi:hypothetical protein
LKPLAKLCGLPRGQPENLSGSYGFAYTDDTGYFLFHGAGVKTTPPLFLAMTNTKGETVYLSAMPFQPAPGSVTYQNITLPSGAQPLGDPPQAIRDVALPSRKNKPSKKTQK